MNNLLQLLFAPGLEPLPTESIPLRAVQVRTTAAVWSD